VDNTRNYHFNVKIVNDYAHGKAGDLSHSENRGRVIYTGVCAGRGSSFPRYGQGWNTAVSHTRTRPTASNLEPWIEEIKLSTRANNPPTLRLVGVFSLKGLKKDSGASMEIHIRAREGWSLAEDERRISGVVGALDQHGVPFG
jgi:hypothetical protein